MQKAKAANASSKESSIENSACSGLRKFYKARTLKLNVKGQRGWPDRLIAIPNVKIFFIEFKRPGEELSEIQKYIIAELRREKHVVYVCDSVEKAFRAAQREVSLQATRLSSRRD